MGNLFFSRKKLHSPVDLSPLGTDIHSHLLPAIDDGCETIEDSLVLIRQLNELGYRKLIVTPHVMSDYYKNTTEAILEKLNTLRDAVKEANIPVTLEAAAEYLLDEGLQEKLKNKQLLTFGENYVLMELSYLSPPKNLLPMIFDMQISGYKLVLAHPERYLYWYNNIKMYEDLKNREVLFQLNIKSIGGRYGAFVRKTAERLIDGGMIEFLGTDAHNMVAIEHLRKCLHEKYLEKVLLSGNLRNVSL